MLSRVTEIRLDLDLVYCALFLSSGNIIHTPMFYGLDSICETFVAFSKHTLTTFAET